MSATTTTRPTFRRGDVVRYDDRANGIRVARIQRVVLVKGLTMKHRYYALEGGGLLLPDADVIEIVEAVAA